MRDAVEESANIRQRPVLMTVIATVLGGLGFAAVSTLFLTPVAYLLLARFAKPKAHEAERLEREMGEANTDLIATPAE